MWLNVCILKSYKGNILFILKYLFAGNDCEFIEVTDGSYLTTGIYIKTDKRVSNAPNNSVWKHPDEDRYIFNTGSAKGWRIGEKSHLKTEEFDYKSEYSGLFTVGF